MGTLYLCTGNVCANMAIVSTSVVIVLWHHRLGHMSKKGIQILHSRKLLLGLEQVDLESVSFCIQMYGVL